MAKRKAKRATPAKRKKAKRPAPRKGRALPAPTGRRVQKVREAVEVVGRDRVKRGPVVIGETRRLTPTRAGFRALDSFLKGVQRAGRKADRELYRLDLNLRWRGPDGRFTKAPPFEGIVLPSLKEARRRRKKGESEAQAFRRLVEVELKKAIFRQVDNVKDLAGGSDELMRRIKGKSPAQVRRLFREFKSRRSLTFKVKINRIMG